MTKFISVHITSCMTRQALANIIKGFGKNSTDNVRHVHTWSDTLSGRMVCEWEATDKETLTNWLGEQMIFFRGEHEWVIPVELESVNGELINN